MLEHSLAWFYDVKFGSRVPFFRELQLCLKSIITFCNIDFHHFHQQLSLFFNTVLLKLRAVLEVDGLMEDKAKMLQGELFPVPKLQNSCVDVLMHVELSQLQVLLGLDVHLDGPDAFVYRRQQIFVFVQLFSVSLSLYVQVRTGFAKEILVLLLLLHFLDQILAHYHFFLVHSKIDFLQDLVFHE